MVDGIALCVAVILNLIQDLRAELHRTFLDRLEMTAAQINLQD
jgi:hypothetical protein